MIIDEMYDFYFQKMNKYYSFPEEWFISSPLIPIQFI